MARGIRDIGLLLARLGLALLLIPYGWAKASDYSATVAGFKAGNVPFPEVSAFVATAGELGGGVLFALGLLTPLGGLFAVAAMFGAVLTQHLPKSFPEAVSADWKGALPLGFGVAALALTVAGPGRLSLDKTFFGRSEWFGARE
ncbi:DoxX family protein [Segniliparus rugosus]|uniref:DoxX family protein n=1 Tax=Segniliparus rugosus (strain ATCC BAA-974 / DSM 45345 / CCUG 50838 / CIP 108380 / JCM 13579 / CDC 945) TaxID=679197 RepID=E5XRD1_SEGRC|nr:DoxX family protein [Segniliparus rugosus]EFV13101.1 hypothetical protein HMPREF9336_02053 [Segniliparus rugosus ATCC BAA-974]